jgi:very-short-patch-repair endonuclease
VGFVPHTSSGVVERNVVRAEDVEPRVISLARRQHGIVASPQLAAAGVTPRWVERRVQRGWLRRLHRGVYLVGPLESPHSLATAAILAAGPGAVVSHYPAAVLHDIRPPREGPIDITIPGRKARSRPGLIIHRNALDPNDITRRHGIPVTSPARTLLDLAATEPTPELDRALNQARIARLVSDPSLNEQFSRYRSHRGTAALRKATRAETGFTRSKAERRTRALIRKARLPEPETNQHIEGYEVDLVWRTERLIAEFDSWTFHSERSSFENDRRRDQHLVAKGWRVIRITWRQLLDEPEAVVAAISAALVVRRAA